MGRKDEKRRKIEELVGDEGYGKGERNREK